ncbi:MAG TPA: 2-hydroxychromene-2-carboxylate isomerase [Pseudolabrys sp.]|nr:2-hydroxychromene-2-carboxylate isomerase [Pseudolabrys sp.]
MAAPIDFWFEFASTYSYPAVMRLDALAEAAGVSVRWRPFLLGPIFKAQGLDNSPFNLFPLKGQYMWRDVERICGALELPFARPGIFPQNGLLAARVALLALDQPWGKDFCRAVYRAQFAEGGNIGEPRVIRDVLLKLHQDADVVLGQAEADDNKAKLRAQTEEALRRGIFGAPSFVVGEELFWGNDRLEPALAWAKRS